MGQPVGADDREAQEEGEVARRLIQQSVGDRLARCIGGQLGDMQVDDQQGDRDGEHGIAEEDDALEQLLPARDDRAG